METFSQWLVGEIQDRDWSMSELARRCNVSHVMISRIVSGERNPSSGLCRSIAQAFGIPPEHVFRRAGLLPSKSQRAEEEEELLHYFDQLSPRDKTRLLALARTFAMEELAGTEEQSPTPPSG
jgi:transcriptional regulator with XRE-family HTH domain